MKKLLLTLTLCITALVSAFGLTACAGNESIKFETLTVNADNTVYGKLPHGTQTFSFVDEIVVAKGVTYTVSTDIYGLATIPTKTVMLNTGDNVFYVLVDGGDNDLTLYTVTLRVKSLYTVTFNTQGGSAVDSQMIEEDARATIPSEPTKTGYTFKGWNFDFNTAITDDITITANAWQANTYTVSFDGNGADNPTGKKATYDSTYGELPTIERAGATFKGWYTAKEGGEKIEGNTIVKTANAHTLYAQWTFDVKYALNAQGTEYKVTGLNNTSKEDIVIVDNVNGIPVTSIGHSAFYNCSSLTSIEIPSSVTSIGNFAFYNCSSLTTVTFRDNSKLKSIGHSAFYNCSSLTSIEIPSSVTSIGENAFSSCDSLTAGVYISDIEAWCNISFGVYYSNPLCNGAHLYLNNQLVTELIIPSSVTSIGDYAFHNCDSLTSIEIPSSVTSIGDYAFHNCDSLTSIEIPSSVTSIGRGAFSMCHKLQTVTFGKNSKLESIGAFAFSFCSKLTSIEIPASVTSIGENAFAGCISLTSIEILASVTSIGENAFAGCRSLTSIEIPSSVTSIGNNAFRNCSSLTTVTFGDNSKLESIGSYAFEYCSKLTSIEIPSSVTSIGEYAFYNYSSLTTVTFGDNSKLESIGDYAFCGHSSLTSIEIPSSVTSIGENAFAGCSSLTTVTFRDNSKLKSIGRSAFEYCSKLTSIEIPSSVTSIGAWAFQYCSSLTSVEIPSSVTSIDYYAFSDCSSLQYNEYDNALYLGNSQNKYLVLVKAKDIYNITSCEISSQTRFILCCAFYSCSSLTSIEIPSSVTSIGSDAFNYCRSLTTVTFGDNSKLERIGYYAFYECYSLTSIEIPASVTSIGSSAFQDCRSLTTVTFGDNSKLERIGNDFDGCSSLTSIEIPESVTSIDYRTFYNCSKLTSINVHVNNNYYCSEDGVLYNKDKTTLVCYPAGKTQTSFIIPASVTSIGKYAFYNCSSLTSIEIPESVTSIGENAFEYCSSLTSIEIPASVTSIGRGVFYYCSSLTSINVHVNNNYYCSEDGVLYNKDKTTLVCYPAGKTQTSFIIPSSVTSIGSWVFYNCSSLTSVAFEDADGWYYTRNHEHNFTGGTAITVTNASQNATYLISTHHYYYWYKVQE